MKGITMELAQPGNFTDGALDLSAVVPIGREQTAFFKRNGCLLIENYLPARAVAALRSKVLDHARSRELIEVDSALSRFRTFNGNEVESATPELSLLYDRIVLGTVQALCGQDVTPMANRRVGLSVNVTPPRGKFVGHFDRNAMTAVLYLNDDFQGGEMVVYPRIRWMLIGRYRPVVRNIQDLLDRAVKSAWYLHRRSPTVVQPKAGNLLVFEGCRSLHRVSEVRAGCDRLSVQFAYDKPGAQFDTADYYGNKQG